jgi:hypothetical protein
MEGREVMRQTVDKRNLIFDLPVRVAMYAALCLSFGTVLAPLAMGQAVAVAEVEGYVTDPGSQAVTGAQVTITETGKNRVHATQTNAQGGGYSFPSLDVGSCDLSVSANGFKRYVQSGIVLQVAAHVGINVQLQLGVVSQTVEVKSNSTMVETKDNSIAQVIDSRQIADLPLNGRNATQLITLTGAATTSASGDLITSKNIRGSSQDESSGGRAV